MTAAREPVRAELAGNQRETRGTSEPDNLPNPPARSFAHNPGMQHAKYDSATKSIRRQINRHLADWTAQPGTGIVACVLEPSGP
jgi:hypothetical protein